MSEANGKKPPLTADHREHLRGSGLTDETIEANGLYSISDRERIIELLGWATPQKAPWSCLAFPFFGHDGRPVDYTRLRPDTPRKDAKGKAVKYESPVGESNRAYFPVHTRRHLLDPAVPLLITEGEKKALKADQEGFPCIGLVGVYGWCKRREGKGPLELIDDLATVPWEGRVAYIVFDSDAARKREVVQAESSSALALEKAGAVVKIVRLPDGPNGEKQGLDDYLLRYGPEPFRELLKTARPIRREAKEQIPEYVPFPVEALPVPVRAYVEQAALALRCDPSFVALPVLAVLASAIGNKRTIRLKRGWVEPAVLWAVIVGESGTLKSPAFDVAVDYLRRLQRRMLKKYREDCVAYQNEKQEYQAAAKRFKEGDGADPGQPPEEPVYRRVVCSDITIEKLADILEDNPAGILSARDELASWFGAFTCYRQKGESNLPYWLEAHRAGCWIVDRKTGPKTHYFVPRSAVCVTGGIQPSVLRRSLTQEFRDAGGQARLLLAMPAATKKEWTEAEIAPETEQTYHDVLDKLYALEFGKDKQDGSKVPHVVNLSNEAKALWVDFYNEWAGEQADAQGDLAAVLSKLEGQAARLALIHHTVTHAHLDTDTLRMVGSRSMKAGITLVRWFAREARRIYGLMGQTEQETLTHALVEFIRGKGGRITARQLQKTNSRRYQTADSANADLQGLVLGGLAVWEPQAAGTKGGRPYRICSLVSLPTQDTTDTTPSEETGVVPTQPPTQPPGSENDSEISNVLEGSVGCVLRRTENNGTANANGEQNGSVGRDGVVSDGPVFEGEV